MRLQLRRALIGTEQTRADSDSQGSHERGSAHGGRFEDTGKGNLFVIFGEPDIQILPADDGRIQLKIRGVDVFDPTTGEIRSDDPDLIAVKVINHLGDEVMKVFRVQ